MTFSRLRMFAGPNGSGKSTLKHVISPELWGIYVNPDDMEKAIRERSFLSLTDYGIQTTSRELSDFLAKSTLLEKMKLLDEAKLIRYESGRLIFDKISMNSYYASAIADFIRIKLLESKQSFTFETVMSSRDKIDLLLKAKASGYRTYLYFVATEHPRINISRVQYRVKMGGHPVPEDKIVNRYVRSLDLLMDAVCSTDRAYVFDNSFHEHIWLAEITEGKRIELKQSEIPAWFTTSLLNKILS